MKQVTIIATVAVTFTYDPIGLDDFDDEKLAQEVGQTLISLTSDMKANMMIDDPEMVTLNEASVDITNIVPSAFKYED